MEKREMIVKICYSKAFTWLVATACIIVLFLLAKNTGKELLTTTQPTKA